MKLCSLFQVDSVDQQIGYRRHKRGFRPIDPETIVFQERSPVVNAQPNDPLYRVQWFIVSEHL